MKKVIKVFALMTVIAVMLSSLTGCKPSDSAASQSTPAATLLAADKSWTNIKDKGTIIVGLDDAFPPMGFHDEKTNEIVGFDIDLAKAVAAKMGIKVEFKPINWDTKDMELSSKNIDLIWNGFTITDERKENILFSKPYLDNKQVIVVAGNSNIKSKADLAGKKVGFQGGSSAEDSIKKDTESYKAIGDANLKSYKDIPTALLDMKAGRIQAVVADEIVVRYHITKNKESFAILSDNFGAEEYGVGMRKADAALKAELDKAFDEVKADAEGKTISDKWFGTKILK
jgi:polar amino acid transport system substrate-binding protein